MNGLSCGEESMTICSAVLIQYQRVTDGRTDRRTDRKAIKDVHQLSMAADARILFRGSCRPVLPSLRLSMSSFTICKFTA